MTDPFQPPPEFSQLRVLVADDKAFIRSIVQGMLHRLRVKSIMQARSGEQAIKVLRKYGHRIGLIISDWNMDPIGGLELLRMVRAREIPGVPPDTCFIMLTGHAKEQVVKTALALDVNAYLVKPVAYEKLVKTMETALERNISLRTIEYYRRIAGVEVPAAVKATDVRVPPWVTWITKSPRRAQLEDRIKQIRRDIAETKEKGNTDDADGETIEIKNMRRMLMDEIKPGCILAEDVYGTDQELLLAAGTLLRPNLLSRLKEIAADGGQEVKLWVGDP